MYDITVENGKYQFLVNNGVIEILRFNEPWLVVERGSKAIIGLLDRVEELEKIVNQLGNKIE